MLFGNSASLSIVALSLSLLVQTTSARLNVYPPAVSKRGDCKTQTVASGDGCGSLASKCGISASDFTKYNSDPKLCSGLAPGQRVCCSAGTLPDIRPKPDKGMSKFCPCFNFAKNSAPELKVVWDFVLICL